MDDDQCDQILRNLAPLTKFTVYNGNFLKVYWTFVNILNLLLNIYNWQIVTFSSLQMAKRWKVILIFGHTADDRLGMSKTGFRFEISSFVLFRVLVTIYDVRLNVDFEIWKWRNCRAFDNDFKWCCCHDPVWPDWAILKALAKKFLPKVVQMFCDFLGSFENHHCSSKIMYG